MNDISMLIPVIGALVALTNIVVEVIKKITWDKFPTNLVATIVAEVSDEAPAACGGPRRRVPGAGRDAPDAGLSEEGDGLPGRAAQLHARRQLQGRHRVNANYRKLSVN